MFVGHTFRLVPLLVLASCVQTQSVNFLYNADDYVKHRKFGTSVVYGQAFLRQRGGGVVLCAGELVLLLPNTGPFKESVAIGRSGKRPVAVSGHKDGVFRDRVTDPQFKDVIRKAQCDAQGNFRFEKVPAANWIIYSRVSWQVGKYNIEQGSDLVSEITPKSGEELQILLTDKNRI